MTGRRSWSDRLVREVAGATGRTTTEVRLALGGAAVAAGVAVTVRAIDGLMRLGAFVHRAETDWPPVTLPPRGPRTAAPPPRTPEDGPG